MKKKRFYERPATKAYNMQMAVTILAGSGNGGVDEIDPFEPGGDPLDPTNDLLNVPTFLTIP